MLITQVQAPDGSVIQVEHPEGASREQILQYAYLKYLDERGMSPVAEGEVPTPMEEPLAPSVGRGRPEYSTGEQLVGVADALASLGLGAFTGTAGMMAGALRGLQEAILTGQLRSDQVGELVTKYSQAYAESATPTPFTEAGTEYAQTAAELLSQLPPVMGSPAPFGAQMARGAGEASRLGYYGPPTRLQLPRSSKAAGPQPEPISTAFRETTTTVAEEMAKAAQAADEAAGAAGSAIRRRVEGMRPTLEATPEDLAAAESANIRLMTSDVAPPRTFMGKMAQAGGERVPISGTGGARVAQQEQRVKAVEDLLREYAPPDAVPAINAVAEDLVATRRDTITNLKNQKTSVINKLANAGTVPVDNTISVIRQEIKRLKSLKDKDLNPVIARLENRIESLQGQDLINVEAIRKQVGETFKAPDLAAVRGIGEEALSRIYKPLREDMTQFIKDNASPQEFTRWQVANKRLAELAGELQENALRNALKRGQQTPEAVSSLLFANKPSYVKSLYRNLSEEGKRAARVALINKAAKEAGGIDNINPQTFARKVKGLSEQTGIFFDKKELGKLNGLLRALDLTDRAQTAGVVTATGQQSVPFVAGSFLTEFLGSTTGAIVGAGTVGALARVYESAPVRNLLMRLGRTKRGSAEEQYVFGEFQKAIAKELAKMTPATVPETARVQLQELEESGQ